jgi:hypothetical protein
LFSFLALTLLSLLALGGCGSTPRTNFYTLSATTAPAEIAPTQRADRVAVGPVTVPDLIDRPQLVMRVTATQVTLLDLHHWAEPLKYQIPGVVATNLANLLSTTRVSEYPEVGGEMPDYWVSVDVQSFESIPGQGVSLDALWAVRRTVAGESRLGRTAVRIPAAGPGYDNLIAAHGVALTRMCEEIADAIRAMQSQVQPGAPTESGP